MASAPWWRVLAMYFPTLGAGIAWAFYARGDVLHSPRPGWFAGDPRAALWTGFACAWLTTMATVWGTRILVAHTQWARRLLWQLRPAVAGASSERLAVVSVLAALGEELLFRAALQGAVGLGVAAAVFGVAHRGPRGFGVAWALWATLMGLVFGGLFEGAGHVIVPIFAHGLINYLNMKFIRDYPTTGPDFGRLLPHRAAARYPGHLLRPRGRGEGRR